MRIKYARKFSFFILWLLYVGLQLVSRKNRYGLVWAMMINPQLPINNEVWNEANIASTGVRLYYHKRRNGKLVMHKPVTRGCAGRRSLPCKIFRPKNVLGHSWKNLGPSQRTLRHSWCPKLVTGLVMHHKSAKSSPLKLDSFEIWLRKSIECS